MNQVEIIKIDHKRKSNQVKKLKRKVKNKTKNTVSLSKLNAMLTEAKRYKVDARNHSGLDDFDDIGYARDEAEKKARIALLEEIIREANDLSRKSMVKWRK